MSYHIWDDFRKTLILLILLYNETGGERHATTGDAYEHYEATCDEQPTIHLKWMEEQFDQFRDQFGIKTNLQWSVCITAQLPFVKTQRSTWRKTCKNWQFVWMWWGSMW